MVIESGTDVYRKSSVQTDAKRLRCDYCIVNSVKSQLIVSCDLEPIRYNKRCLTLPINKSTKDSFVQIDAFLRSQARKHPINHKLRNCLAKPCMLADAPLPRLQKKRCLPRE